MLKNLYWIASWCKILLPLSVLHNIAVIYDTSSYGKKGFIAIVPVVVRIDDSSHRQDMEVILANPGNLKQTKEQF